MSEQAPEHESGDDGILVVRPGGGANCSSVGSVVDMLFVAGTLGGALLVAVTAALGGSPPGPLSPPGTRGKEQEREASEESNDETSSADPPRGQERGPGGEARVEPFGAWVRLDEPRALVAIDQERARALGLDGGALWSDATPRASAPLEVHMAVSARCGVGCAGCYLDATPQGAMPPLSELTERLAALKAAGVFTVAFGGGEPLLRRDLEELAAHARALGLTPVTTTSGVGLTEARAARMRVFEQVNVSHDGVAGGYEAVRGVDGAGPATRAISLLSSAGVRVGVNLALTRQNFAQVEATAAHVASLGAREIQLLRYKPAGRGASLDYLSRRLSGEQIARIPALLASLVRGSGLSVRIDCAMAPWLESASFDPRTLERFGIFGCEAGHHLAAATVDGRVAPCSFAGASALPVQSLRDGWSGDPTLAAFREHSAQAPAPCSSCAMRAVCRGGCRVVAAWYGDPSAPDPECPRVAAFQAEAARA